VIAAWIRIVLARDLSRGMLATASVATAIAMTGAAFVRESMRLAALVGTVAAPREPRNAAGFVVFALFAVAGLATIAWILRAVSRDMRTTGAAR
jgi:Mg2+/Co2+ transporter CorC